MGPAPILRGIAYGLGGIALLMAALEFAGGLAPEREVRGTIDEPVRTELQRCRDLTPEDLGDDAGCRDTWDENRRRFFGTTLDGHD